MTTLNSQDGRPCIRALVMHENGWIFEHSKQHIFKVTILDTLLLLLLNCNVAQYLCFTKLWHALREHHWLSGHPSSICRWWRSMLRMYFRFSAQRRLWQSISCCFHPISAFVILCHSWFYTLAWSFQLFGGDWLILALINAHFHN